MWICHGSHRPKKINHMICQVRQREAPRIPCWVLRVQVTIEKSWDLLISHNFADPSMLDLYGKMSR